MWSAWKVGKKEIVQNHFGYFYRIQYFGPKMRRTYLYKKGINILSLIEIKTFKTFILVQREI